VDDGNQREWLNGGGREKLNELNKLNADCQKREQTCSSKVQAYAYAKIEYVRIEYHCPHRIVVVSGYLGHLQEVLSFIDMKQPSTTGTTTKSPPAFVGLLRWCYHTKAGMVHSVSGCTRGVQVKLWDPLRTRAISERLRGVITTRRYTNPRLPYLYHQCARLSSDEGPYWPVHQRPAWRHDRTTGNDHWDGSWLSSDQSAGAPMRR